MKATMAALLLALWQGGFQHEGEVPPALEHFRYVRTLTLPAEAAGQACAVLDATVYAHADAALNALRLYAKGSEVPFVFTTSGEVEQETEMASILRSEMREGRIVFDLKMPSRPYTEVDLDLAGHDFVATASVSGQVAGSEGWKDLGKFEVFDLSSQGLGRSLALPLQEETFPVLRIELEVSPSPGARNKGFGTAMVRGASVPPTRDAQSIYTTVEETHQLAGAGDGIGNSSVATFALPPHVPVERVSFRLKPGFTGNFMRPVRVRTKSAEAGDSPDGAEPLGEIQRVQMPGEAGGPEVREQRLSLPVETMANVRGTALVEVAVENGRQPPLPLDSVALEMRQRRICFAAQPQEIYELRYGDDVAVSAPVYQEEGLFRPGEATLSATMLAETENPEFVPRRDERTYRERHPELLWIGLIALAAVLGGTAIHNVKGQGRRR